MWKRNDIVETVNPTSKAASKVSVLKGELLLGNPKAVLAICASVVLSCSWV